MRTGKKIRQALLEQQNCECKLCSCHLSDTKHARRDNKLHYLLCPACALLISNIRRSYERGIMFADIVDYEGLDPQDNPVVKSDRRQCVEDGRVSYREPNGTYRPYESWDEACSLHPDWAEAEERLNN